MVGQVDTSGHELEANSASDKNSKSTEETFYGGSLFVEASDDNGFAIGLDYVPLSVDIGSSSAKELTLQLEQTLSPKQTLETEVLHRGILINALHKYTCRFRRIFFWSLRIFSLHYTTIKTDEKLPNPLVTVTQMCLV